MRSQIFWVRVEMFWTDVNESGDPGADVTSTLGGVSPRGGDTDVVHSECNLQWFQRTHTVSCNALSFISQSPSLKCLLLSNTFFVKTKYWHAPTSYYQRSPLVCGGRWKGLYLQSAGWGREQRERPQCLIRLIIRAWHQRSERGVNVKIRGSPCHTMCPLL